MNGPNVESIEFYVCLPIVMIQKVKARPADQCGVIRKLFPGRDMAFVHQGERIDLNTSLQTYGVKNGDVVVAVDDSQSAINRTDHWLNVTRSSDHFQDTVQGLMTRSTRQQLLTMRDLVWAKTEARPRRYRRAMANFQSFYAPQINNQQSNPSVIGEAPLEPSTAPLTFEWQ
jgi:hypothetical protein